MTPALPLSPLQLQKYGFTTVRVEAIKDGSATAEPCLKPTIWFEPLPEKADHWQLFLTLILTSSDPANRFAYEVEIKLQGLVQVNEGFPPAKKEQLALVNGFSILYSAAREMLLNITSRSPKGAVALPTVSFVKLVDEALKQKAEAEKPTPAPQSESAQS
jgi:preprotein translocase subunit SecB